MSFFKAHFQSMPLQWRSAASVVLGSAMISFSPFLVEFSSLSAFANGFYRMAIGGAILLALAFFRREPLPGARVASLCFFAALTIALDTVVWNQSVFYIGSGLSTVLANVEVFFMVIMGVLFFKEKLQPQFLGISGVILVGIVCLVYPYIFDMTFHKGLGISLALAASFIYSVYFMLLKLIGTKNRQPEISTISMLATICLLAALILAVCIALIPSETFAIVLPQSFACVVLNGVLGQVLGWLLITHGLKNIGFSLSGLLMLTQPALTFIFDCIFLGRNTQSIQIWGCVTLLSAVYYTMQLNKKKEVQHAST